MRSIPYILGYIHNNAAAVGVEDELMTRILSHVQWWPWTGGMSGERRADVFEHTTEEVFLGNSGTTRKQSIYVGLHFGAPHTWTYENVGDVAEWEMDLFELQGRSNGVDTGPKK